MNEDQKGKNVVRGDTKWKLFWQQNIQMCEICYERDGIPNDLLSGQTRPPHEIDGAVR
jgi:hypothetical protein